ncbi:MAG: hypothetical protein HY788_00165 [Deltaproteobacteria bacterium]|nr:hypothetical protein [Deltaproteobacteria bacterium]
MKKAVLVSALVLCSMLMSYPAFAGQWEGTIQGLMCTLEKKPCPVGFEDALTAMEPNFVLVTSDGSWYMLPNMDRAVLARRINQDVMVVGEKNPEYNSIKVDELKAKADGSWTTVWSTEMEKELRKMFKWGLGGSPAHPK